MFKRVFSMLLVVLMVTVMLPATQVFAASGSNISPRIPDPSAVGFGTITDYADGQPEYVGPKHVYEFEVLTGGTMSIYLSRAVGNLESVRVTIRDQYGMPLPDFAYIVWQVPSQKDVSLTAGVYTIEVEMNGTSSSSTTGGYQLNLRFVEKYSLTVRAFNPIMGSASADLSILESDGTTTLTAKANTGYVFDRWELVSGVATFDNSKASSTVLRMKADENGNYGDLIVEAHFKQTLGVTLVQPQHGGNISVDKTSASPGETVTLMAYPANGYVFDRWIVTAGNATINGIYSSTVSFTMPDAGVSITAQFKSVKNIVIGSLSGGTVSVSKYSAYAGDTVYIDAYPNKNMDFVSWNVQGASAVMNINSVYTSFIVGDTQGVVTVSATFKEKDPAEIEYTVSVIRNSSSWGYVSQSKTKAKNGEVVTITATPYSTGKFERWEVVSGDITLDNPESKSTTFTVGSSDVSVRAIFGYGSGDTGNTVTVAANESTYGTAMSSVTQASSGTEVLIGAAPSIGYAFTRWEVVSGGVTIKNPTLMLTSFIMGSQNASVRAVFTKTDTTTGGTTTTGGSDSWSDYLGVLNSISPFTSSADSAARLSRLAGSVVVGGLNGYSQPAVIVQDVTSKAYFMNGFTIELSTYGITTTDLGSTSSPYNKVGTYTTNGANVTVYTHKNLTQKEIRVIDANIAAGMLVNAEMQPGSGTPLGSSSWATTAIQAAINAGVVPQDILSNYTASITRAEYCKLAVYTMMAKYGYGNDLAGFIARTGVNLSNEPFSDTSDQYIKVAYAMGIINGTKSPTATEKGTFAPFNYITRQESAVMASNMGKALGYTPSGAPISFSDASSIASWAKAGVDFATSAKIMQGTSANPPQFSPLGTYTREQAIATLMNFYGQLPVTMPSYISIR